MPFLFAGLAVAIVLQEFPEAVHRTYFWNLLGSGLGCFLFVLLIRALGGAGELFLFASMGGIAGHYAVNGCQAARLAKGLAVGTSLLFPLAVLVPGLKTALVPLAPAPSKALAMFSEIFPQLEERARREDPEYQGADESLRKTLWTPLCRLDSMPVPQTLGQAKRDRAGGGPRSQIHLFQDGDAPTVIWSKAYADEVDYREHFYGLAYELVERPDVLVLGPGGGNDVETALHHGAVRVTAVDINGDILRLVRETFGDYTGGIYSRPGVRVVHSEGRSFLRREEGSYDLLQMSGTDTYAALASGSYIFSESYLYTEEAFDDFFADMAGNGVISVIRFRFEPPRETLKLVGTAARALRRLGHEDLRRHFIVVHQEDRQAMKLGRALGLDLQEYLNEPIRYSCTLMRKRPFAAAEVGRIEQALGPMNRNPDVEHALYYGAGHFGEADNEYLRLLSAMEEGPEAERSFLASYPYAVEPASDDRPFFFNFYSWSDLRLFAPRGKVGYRALTGSEPIGLYILAALLLLTALAALLLILLPLFRLGVGGEGSSRGRAILYFAALGLAYLLVEITTLQRFVLYLGHPSFALTIGLCSFLVFSGLGSAWAGRCQARPALASLAAGLTVLLLLLHALLLPPLLRATLDLGVFFRLAISAAAIAPLAFCMGMPFPTGLKMLEGRGMISWAFGVNGAASVLASVLSVLLAMELGFTFVFFLAALCYLAAAFSVPRRRPVSL
ncbi:MAG: spermidine synthase [Planctomycetota bacterium]